MKRLVFVVILSFITIFSYCQVEKLTAFEKTKKNEIKIGMSVTEVKTLLGNPKAIEVGFPDSDKSIIDSMPDQHGQMNYTTWLYFYPIMTILRDDLPPDYLVNDKRVSKDDYDSYKNLNEVYFWKGVLISPYTARSLKARNDTSLITQKKTSMKIVPFGKYKTAFIPVLCIVFEKGTQSVGDSRMYFIKQ